jgi:NAD(P)-dependent dehydrogenase (short-subunit alcohol dehydrogenase family)
VSDRLDVFAKFRLDGEVALVTGAGNGIGRVAALTLAEAGARIAVTDIDLAAAEMVAAEIAATDGAAKAYPLDVADESAIVTTVRDVAMELGRIDVLISNAGATKRHPTEDFATEDWERVIATNATASFVVCREVGRHMLAARRGRIVIVSSIMGLVGGGMFPSIAYHASKGALVSMTRALAAEWASRGIRVNAIAPTFVATRFTEVLRKDEAMVGEIVRRTPMGRFAEAEEMAGGILYLASEASSMVTGQILAIDGGWTAV